MLLFPNKKGRFRMLLEMYFQRPVSTGLGQEFGLAVAEIIIISAHVTKVYKWSLGKKMKLGLIKCKVT